MMPECLERERERGERDAATYWNANPNDSDIPADASSHRQQSMQLERSLAALSVRVHYATSELD